MLLSRSGLITAYKRREQSKNILDPDAWLAGFGLLAIGSSMMWGLLCLIALAYSHDPLLCVVPILSTVGTAGAVAARNSGVPRLARLQLFCSLAPILVGCLLADDHGFRVLLILVSAMAAGLSILIAERNEQLVELIETQAELSRLSQTDALTQLSNRRSFDLALEHAVTDTARFAMLMVDVDHFKAFNDRYGHPAGDALLQNVASVLRGALQDEDDIVARYGGEEFAVLLINADRLQAINIGERMRGAVQSACFDIREGTTVTISVGCAHSYAGCDAKALVAAADAALYRAKRAGRNRTEGCRPWYDERAVA